MNVTDWIIVGYIGMSCSTDAPQFEIFTGTTGYKDVEACTSALHDQYPGFSENPARFSIEGVDGDTFTRAICVKQEDVNRAEEAGEAVWGEPTCTPGYWPSSEEPEPPTPNPKLENIADNTWIKLHDYGIEIHGHFAYSGGAYDRKRHQFLAFGGGHNDGWMNDVLRLNLADDTWQSMYEPTGQGAYNCDNVNNDTPGMLLEDGKPASRHTYDQMGFIESIGKVIMWSGNTYVGIWDCPGNLEPVDTWLYDFDANDWEYRNLSREPQPQRSARTGAYDPVSEKYWGYANGRMWTYDPDTDLWTQETTTAGPREYDGNLVADRKGKLWLGGPHPDGNSGPYVSSFDTTTRVWTQHSPIPDGAVARFPSYDEAHGVLLFFHEQTATLSAYHTETGEWETFEAQGEYPSRYGRPYGRWFYDPVGNAHTLIVAENYHASVYAYRYKAADSPEPPPEPPSPEPEPPAATCTVTATCSGEPGFLCKATCTLEVP